MNLAFRRACALSVTVLAAIILLGGCAPTGNPDLPPPAATVEMKGHSFDPPSVTINAGESVLWHNAEWAVVWHTVTADPAEAEMGIHVKLPPGAEKFDSGDVPPGKTFQRVFTVPGTYRYFCKPHESKGMVGEVIVKPASGHEAPPATQASP